LFLYIDVAELHRGPTIPQPVNHQPIEENNNYDTIERGTHKKATEFAHQYPPSLSNPPVLPVNPTHNYEVNVVSISIN